MMEILLSNLLAESAIVTEQPQLINEKSFRYFARATSPLSEAKCLFVGQAKYAGQIDEYTQMVVTNEQTYAEIKDKDCGFCLTESPRDLFFQLMDEHEQRRQKELPQSVIGKNCSISARASVAECGVVIGDNVIVEEFAQIAPNTIIGDNSIICAGAKIGVQAFNIYEYGGKRKRLYHGGKTVIGKNVLVSHNTVVEQALYSYGATIIGDDTKIDVNAVIGHNDNIGQKCEITAGACIAGYVTVGDNTIVRLGALVRNGMIIGSNAHIGIGSVVVRKVKDGANMFGNPAKNLNKIAQVCSGGGQSVI